MWCHTERVDKGYCINSHPPTPFKTHIYCNCVKKHIVGPKNASKCIHKHFYKYTCMSVSE